MIVIDFSQLVFNSLFVIKKDKKDVHESMHFLKHLILNQILSISSEFKRECEVVLASDFSSWRKKAFQSEDGKTYYKASRHSKREDDDFDWETFWKSMKEFQQELKDYFPFIIVSVYGAEGDDVIGTLGELKGNIDEEFIIISSDKDFVQLQKYRNVIQYSPRNMKRIQCVNPTNELMWLILSGDRADGIPNVKSPANAFMPEGKTVRMWQSTKVWEHIENNTVMSSLLCSDELKSNFKRNQMLIDLTCCPEDIKRSIIREYNAEKERLSEKSENKLFNFFIAHQMKNLMNRMGEYERFFHGNDDAYKQKFRLNRKDPIVGSNIMDILV